MLNARLADASRSVARSAGPGGAVPVARARSAGAGLARRVPRRRPLRACSRQPPPEVRTDHVAPIRASVRDAVETILALLPATGAVRFRDLTLGAHEKLEIIVRFLAVLELFKQGVIDLEQSESFADLIVLPLAPGERVELDLLSIADLDGEPIVPDRRRPDPTPSRESSRVDRRRGARVSTDTVG